MNQERTTSKPQKRDVPMVLLLAMGLLATSTPVAAEPTVLPESEAEVLVDGSLDSILFYGDNGGLSLTITSPNGEELFITNGLCGTRAFKVQLDGQVTAGACGTGTTTQGNLDGVPADGTWTVEIHTSTVTNGYELVVGGKKLVMQTQTEAYDPQLWNWHETSGTFQDDVSTGDADIADEENPLFARYYGPVGAPPSPPPGSSTETRRLLHLDNVTVLPAQSQPGEDIGGIVTDDYPGSDPQALHDGTPAVPTQDHEGSEEETVHDGTDPVPIDPVGHDAGTLTVGDDDDNLCVWFTPEETGQPQEVACVDRDFLVGLDGLVPRGDTPVAFHEDPEDVPASGPVTIPGTDPQEVPDVPVLVPGGTVVVPEHTATVDVSYRYDPGHLDDLLSLLGETVWSPFDGPLDAQWYATHGDDVPLVVQVTLYEDGDEIDTFAVSVPYLGQALAAAEKTAGTL